jgi:hypothetical protein
MTNLQLSLFLAFTALFIGTAMGVVQVTVQVAAGAARLGTAAASVQFSRSLGAALGTATVGAILFGVLAVVDPHATAIFARLFQATADPLAGLSDSTIAMIRDDIRFAFRVCFSTIAFIAACETVLAWTIPLRRI